MYSAIHSLPLDVGHGEFQGALDGTNLPGDACLVLTSDPKPRLRWTAELHERFVDAVTQLGGPDSAYTNTATTTTTLTLFLFFSLGWFYFLFRCFLLSWFLRLKCWVFVVLDCGLVIGFRSAF
jgi:hypothetical protein